MDTLNHRSSAQGGPLRERIVRDPVCGMTVDPSQGAVQLRDGDHDFHFCSSSCADKFASHPENYTTATDVVCGMDVARASARFMKKYQGALYYFCSGHCEEKFEADSLRVWTDEIAP